MAVCDYYLRAFHVNVPGLRPLTPRRELGPVALLSTDRASREIDAREHPSLHQVPSPKPTSLSLGSYFLACPL